jgi:hypothetical protein
MSARDLEERLQLARGKGNGYVDFDVRPGEFEYSYNPDLQEGEYSRPGDFDLSGRNPTMGMKR